MVSSVLLLLFPKIFVFANVMMLFNCLFTIVCFLILNNLKGAGIELINALIPMILLYIGYPKVFMQIVNGL